VGDFEWAAGQDDAFFSWIAGIAENAIRTAAQKRKSDFLELEREPAASQLSPSQAMRREERYDRLEDALNKLPPDHREVCVFRTIPARDSGRFRPPIPIDSGHLFRRKPARDSD